MNERTLQSLKDVLVFINSHGETNGDSQTESDKDHLIPSPKDHTVISLTDSGSSESEFDDIIPKERTTTENNHAGRTVTNTGTILHILKANVWTGLLAMPKAMSHFGLLAGVLGIFILGSIYIYCIHLLLDINRAIVKRVMLDRKVNELKQTIIYLIKIHEKLKKQERKKLKEAAEACANAAEVASINSTILERESSASYENSSNKKHSKWKLKYAKDFEIGESSRPKEEYSKKKSSNLNKTDVKRGSPASNKNKSKKNSAKLNEKDVKEESFTINKDSSKKNYTKLNEEEMKGKSSASNKDSSKKFSSKLSGKDVKGKSSASNKLRSKKNPAKYEEIDADCIEKLEFSESSQDNSNKNSTILKEESSASNKSSSKKIPAKYEEIDADCIEELEFSESSQDNSNNSTVSQEENNSHDDDDETLLKCSEDMIVRTLDYPKLVELSFHYGLPRNKWASKVIKFYVQALMILTHVGCCCICFLFTAETLSELTAVPLAHSSSFQMVAYAVPFIICLSFIPDGHELTGVTTVAFLLQLCGVLMMLYYFFKGPHSTDLNLYLAPAETWYLYFGIIFYAFEGTGVTLHLESHMEKKQDFRGWNGVLNKSMFFVIPLYAVFGGLGYWKFGGEVKTSVTFNLPEQRIPDIIQVMTIMGMLLTYPFHLSFVLTPLKKQFIANDCTQTQKNVYDLVLRAGFVVFTFLASALIPYLELQLSILGSVASCFLVLVVPPYMSLNCQGQLPDLNYSCCRMLFHTLIIIIGISGTFVGSYTTFTNIHKFFPNSSIFE